MELASIVVPVYNIELYIEKCIKSLQDQTYKEIEILLVDDGSLDQSGDICDQYAKRDERIRVLHKKNGGLSDARNYGASHAKGTYLFFVDGDDTVSEELVERTVKCARKQQADMVFFDFASIEEETGRRDIYHYGLPEKGSFQLKTNPEVLIKSPSACCILYRRDFFLKSGICYPEGLHYEDLATTPRLLLKAERIGYVGIPMYDYMQRSGSIMHSHNFERNYKDRTYVLKCLKNYFREQDAEKLYKKELEYLFFEHGYFVPSKEIILADGDRIWLQRFRKFAVQNYPELFKNPYIKQLSPKDKILLFLMKRKMYGAMNLLSSMRKKKDHMNTVKQSSDSKNA